MLKILSALSAITLAITNSTLAEENATSAPNSPTVKPTFVVSCWGAWKGKPLFAKTRKDFVKIELHDLALSASIPFSRSEPITIFEQNPKPSTDSPEFLPKTKISIPPTIKKPLIVLFPNKTNKIAHRLFDISPSTFSGGSYRMVNLTKIPIRIDLAKKAFILKPGEDSLASRNIKKKTPIQIKASIADANNQALTVYSTAAMNRPSKRMIMFFFPARDENGKPTVTCKSIVDFIQTP